MAYRRDEDHEDDEADEAELDDGNYPDESDQDATDEPPEVECPYCGQPVPEDAELCPHCRSFISIEDAPPARPPWWIWIAVIGGLLAVVVWAL